jgi:hypothetical protein
LIKKGKAKRKAKAKSAITDKAENFVEPDDKTIESAAIAELLLNGSDAWKEEFKETSLAWQELKRTSDTFDLKDPYWANLFLKRALDALDESASSQAETDVPYQPDRTSTLAPTMGTQLLKLQGLEEGLDPNNLVISTPRKTRHQEIQETEARATPVKRLDEITEGGSGMYNTMATFLEERQFWNAELNAADQVEDGKPVNMTAALIVPDETTQGNLAEIDRALDNTKLQREDVAKAKKTFNIPQSSDILNVKGMRISKAPTLWQLLAADAMHDAFNDEEINGMLLADDVGLGKTWSCMTFLLKVGGN